MLLCFPGFFCIPTSHTRFRFSGHRKAGLALHARWQCKGTELTLWSHKYSSNTLQILKCSDTRPIWRRQVKPKRPTRPVMWYALETQRTLDNETGRLDEVILSQEFLNEKGPTSVSRQEKTIMYSRAHSFDKQEAIFCFPKRLRIKQQNSSRMSFGTFENWCPVNSFQKHEIWWQRECMHCLPFPKRE